MSKERKNKVIFWTTAIDLLHRNVGNIGGIAVQMNYWSQEFIKNDWQVYSLSQFEKKERNGIRFVRVFYIRYIRIFLEFILSFVYLSIIRPDLVVTRGADRQLGYLSIYTKFLGIKYVHFAASDADFELSGNPGLNKKDNSLYVYGLRRLKYIVVQNLNQVNLLQRNHYRKQKTLVIPNIWVEQKEDKDIKKDIDFLWVSNLRELKRPLWFLELAKKNPRYEFVMIGGASDKTLYHKCEQEAKDIHNLLFLGSKTFEEVNKYFTHAKCFICTSRIEGFPNTFLQAWSNNIPVLTSFDPSDRVTTYNLGIYVTGIDEMNEELLKILSCDYKKMQENIKMYFSSNHDVAMRYKELIQFVSSK